MPSAPRPNQRGQAINVAGTRSRTGTRRQREDINGASVAAACTRWLAARGLLYTTATNIQFRRQSS